MVSLTFGIPSSDIIHRLKENHIVLTGVATSTEEAKKIEQEGLEIIVAQGIEAGGHRASFLSHDLPQVELAQVRSIATAFILGSQGVQIGSAFLRSKESPAGAIKSSFNL